MAIDRNDQSGRDRRWTVFRAWDLLRDRVAREKTGDFATAREPVMSMAERLGLRDSERKSYLCLILEQDEKK